MFCFFYFSDTLQQEVVGLAVAVPLFVMVAQPLLNIVTFNTYQVVR